MTTTDGQKRNSIKILSTIGAGAAVTSTWCKPVIEGIVLPAHARTSDCGQVQISFSGQVTGDHAGGATYVVYTSPCSEISRNSETFSASTDVVFPINLNPGSYLVSISSNSGNSSDTSTGSSNYTVSIGCCDSEPELSSTVDISGSSMAISDLFAEVIIGDDMSCHINELRESDFPCDAA